MGTRIDPGGAIRHAEPPTDDPRFRTGGRPPRIGVIANDGPPLRDTIGLVLAVNAKYCLTALPRECSGLLGRFIGEYAHEDLSPLSWG